MPNVGRVEWVSDNKEPSDHLENQRFGQAVDGAVTVRKDEI